MIIEIIENYKKLLVYNSKFFFACVCHFIDTLERKKIGVSKLEEIFSYKKFLPCNLNYGLFVPHAVSIIKKKLNGGDEPRSSSGGNFTEEDSSTCYNTLFSYQINFSHTMVTHISKTLMSRQQVNFDDASNCSTNFFLKSFFYSSIHYTYYFF